MDTDLFYQEIKFRGYGITHLKGYWSVKFYPFPKLVTFLCLHINGILLALKTATQYS